MELVYIFGSLKFVFYLNFIAEMTAEAWTWPPGDHGCPDRTEILVVWSGLEFRANFCFGQVRWSDKMVRISEPDQIRTCDPGIHADEAAKGQFGISSPFQGDHLWVRLWCYFWRCNFWSFWPKILSNKSIIWNGIGLVTRSPFTLLSKKLNLGQYLLKKMNNQLLAFRKILWIINYSLIWLTDTAFYE